MNEVQRNFKKQMKEIEREKKQRSMTFKNYRTGAKTTYYLDKKGNVVDKEITNDPNRRYFKPKTSKGIIVKIIILAVILIAAVIVHSFSINGHHYFFFFIP